MLWGEVGKSQFLCYLAGHAKEPGFNPGSSGKPLEGFKRETEMILTYAFKELFGCCVESGERRYSGSIPSPYLSP